MDGLAADVSMIADDQDAAGEIAIDMISEQGGVGISYGTIVHVDFGPGGRIW